MEKNASDGPKWDPRRFFLPNPDLADILSRTDLNFEIFYFFLIFWTPHFWISRSPDLQISGFPSPQISKFPDSQISRFPDFQTPPPPPPPLDELSDPNLTPLPTHPGMKYVARALAAIKISRQDGSIFFRIISQPHLTSQNLMEGLKMTPRNLGSRGQTKLDKFFLVHSAFI